MRVEFEFEVTYVCNNQIVVFPLHDRGLVLQVVRVRKASTSCVSQAEGES